MFNTHLISEQSDGVVCHKEPNDTNGPSPSQDLSCENSHGQVPAVLLLCNPTSVYQTSGPMDYWLTKRALQIGNTRHITRGQSEEVV